MRQVGLHAPCVCAGTRVAVACKDEMLYVDAPGAEWLKANFSAALSLSHHVVRAAVETHGFTCYDAGDSDSDWADSDGEANRIVSVASAARAAAERAGKRPPTHRTPTKAKRTVARTPDSPI